ncbi:DUF1476 domain-containing protein [Albimonas sp. CAU 1670]|uniref:DUF1476 domain-containing protein n=1 Tax=Albimonas sp. CAU 1670 TaxID=3032599 RepID=UPI0023D9D1F8|nr:DUF1476 domain-containing protein [Albimonas sp. CAU 1670]MDF2232914.1 DUF1476 domain-containing protein [Albimonas sp. CAU 1670]
MTTFDDREKAFENKYAHDEEMRFRAQARRDRLLGLWAAGLMGLEGDAAADYARSIVVEDLKEAGDDDVYRKVKADMEAKNLSTDGLRAKMEELLIEAKVQVMGEVE